MSLPPPPSAADDVKDVRPDTKERVLGGIGGFLSGATGQDFSGTPLDKMIEQHHQKRLDEARMYRRNAATFAGILATGHNPDTGAPLTDEERRQYQNQYDASWAQYEKSAGVSKDVKQHLATHKQLLDRVISQGTGGAGNAGGQPATSGASGGLPMADDTATPSASTRPSAPPTPPASPASPAAPSAASTLPPPPTLDSQMQADAPRLAQRLTAQQDFSDYQRQQDLLHQHKMEEAQAHPKRLQAKNFRRPGSDQIESGSYDPTTGEFLDQEGRTVPGAVAVPTSGPRAAKFGTFVPDPESPTGYSRNILDPTTLQPNGAKDYGIPPGQLPKFHTQYKIRTNQDGSQELVPVTTYSGGVVPKHPSGAAAASSKASGGGGGSKRPSPPPKSSATADNELHGRGFGHKPLDAMSRRSLVAANQALDGIDRVSQVFDSNPDLKTDNNPITPAIDWLEYQHGHFEPGDPVRSQLIKESALIGITASGLYSQGRMSRYLFDKAQQHLPQPNDSPQLLYSKVKWLKDNHILDDMIKDIENPMRQRGTPGEGKGGVIVVSPEDMR